MVEYNNFIAHKSRLLKLSALPKLRYKNNNLLDNFAMNGYKHHINIPVWNIFDMFVAKNVTWVSINCKT